MHYPAFFWSISAGVTVCLRATLKAAAIASLAGVGQAVSMDQTIPADETSIISAQELPVDALGYLGGLF